MSLRKLMLQQFCCNNRLQQKKNKKTAVVNVRLVSERVCFVFFFRLEAKFVRRKILLIVRTIKLVGFLEQD